MPLVAMVLPVIVLVILWLINTTMYASGAMTATDGILRAGGLGALTQTDPDAAYTRWFTSPENGTRIARSIAAYDLGAYSGLLRTSPAAALSPSGTEGGGADGIDVEVINPAQEGGQTSERFMNCDPLSICTSDAVEVSAPGVFPELVRSEITGQYYDTATVVLRARLTVLSFGMPDTVITRVIVIRAGTDNVAP
jgi:hypothetical protein